MKLCIHKLTLGTNDHLLYDGTQFVKSNHIPEDAWIFGDEKNHIRSVEPLFKIIGEDIQFPPDDRYREQWCNLKKTSGIKWAYCLPGQVFKSQLQKLLDQLWLALSALSNTYYLNEFYDIRKLLLRLSRAKIDTDLAYKILDQEKSASNSSNLRKFLPKGEEADLPIYSQISTVTGRLTVVDGPSILTLKREHRRIIRSRYPRGRIVEIDFRSLEPRVMLEHADIRCEDDIYEFIAREVFKSQASRSVVKVLTLGVLYGLGISKFSEKIDTLSRDEILEYTKKIRSFFKIDKLGRMLTSDVHEGMIQNAYGRKICVEGDPTYVIVNRFVQSSAADAALLAFSSLCDNIKDAGIEAKPLFLIHDAIIFDVSENDIDQIKSMIEDGLWVPKFNKKFPVSYKQIS